MNGSSGKRNTSFEARAASTMDVVTSDEGIWPVTSVLLQLWNEQVAIYGGHLPRTRLEREPEPEPERESCKPSWLVTSRSLAS